MESLQELYNDDNPIQELAKNFSKAQLKYISVKNVPFCSLQGFNIPLLKQIVIEMYKNQGQYNFAPLLQQRIIKSYSLFKEGGEELWEKELQEILKV